MFRQDDPGPCPICGAAHSACTAVSGPIAVAQLPARDALAAVTAGVTAEATPSAQRDVAQQVAADRSGDLGDGSDDRPFSTATYRGKKKQR